MPDENDSASDVPKTPEERPQRRFARRWKRRARILGPFLGISLVVGALALSMDLVRHMPEAQVAKAQARAAKTRPLAKANRASERPVRHLSKKRASARRGGVIQPNAPTSDVLDPHSISLGMPDANTDSARIPVSTFLERRTR